MNDWVTTSTILLGLREFDNHHAWQRFADRFRRPIVAFAREMGLNGAGAEDCAQETLMEFAKALRDGKYDPHKGRLSAWLFGIAYRKTLNARRAGGRRASREAAGADTSFWAALPDEREATRMFDAQWERAVLERCLEQVRREVADHTYEAFVLTVCRGQSSDEAAAALGIPRASVYTAKHRVLKRVRALRRDYELVA